MQTRPLGRTGLNLPILSFGASSLGQEFRSVKLDEAINSVRVALECGLNFIDTSPFYGRGMSEVFTGIALRDVPRDQYLLCTKLGRYDLTHFDFSAKRVAESVDVSLHRLGTDHLDICLCHDIEFVEMQQIVDETLPALRKQQQAGKVRFVGISGYPMKLFRFVLDQTDLDCVLSYNQYCLQNTRFADELVPDLKAKGVGVMNAGPFAARLLTNSPLPAWHKEPLAVRKACRRAAEHCTKHGVDIAARRAVLDRESRHHDDRCRQCEPEQHTQMGRVGRSAARPTTADRCAQDPGAGQEHRPPRRAAEEQLIVVPLISD